ncbi:MAG: tol-pal system YbgF family protein [bacterium]
MSHYKDNSDSIDRYERRLRKLRSSQSCPSAEKLGIYVNNKLGDRETKNLNEHFDLCPACLDAVRQLQKNREQELDAAKPPQSWPTLEKKMDEKVYAFLESLQPAQSAPDLALNAAGSLSRVTTFVARLLTPRKFAYAGLAAALIITSLYAFAFLSRAETFQLAQIQLELKSSSRGTSDREDFFNKGLTLFEEGDFEPAIQNFEIYRKEHANHYAVHFYLGVAHLARAERAFLGLPYRFDPGDVSAGIAYLQQAMVLTNNNAFYLEDCLWYLGKAHLMLKDTNAATQYFKQLRFLEVPGLMRKAKARKVLAEIAQFE